MQPWVPTAALTLISCLTTTLYFFSTPDSLSATSEANSGSDAAWRRGYWGKPDAEFNWCEPDYVDSPYVAETWNSFTSLLYLAPAVVGFWNAKNVAPCSKGARRFYVLLMSVAMVAIGSTIFHATLLYPSQLLDELPMFYLVLSAAFILFHRDGEMSSLYASWGCFVVAGLIAFLLVWEPKDTLLHTVGRGFLTLGFTACFIYIFYASCSISTEMSKIGTEVSKRASTDVSTLFELSFYAFIFAIVCWIIDVMRCSWLHTLPVYPQLHALGWHVFSAAGIYPLFVVLVLNHEIRKGKKIFVNWRTLGFKTKSG